ncbi:MAG: helix-turn-helix domain-containing protein [Actinobacteria bacterium]|nr:helix-turn-helix domain-containing protein [Actinomycetota bacterium]
MHADGSAEDRWLRALGTRLRDTRTALRVSSTSAAQSAGVSRMTWHRMESGSPNVSAGAYAAVLIDRLRRLSISLASAWPIDDEKRG